MAAGVGFGDTSASRLAVVVSVIVFISWMFEYGLNFIEQFYRRRGLAALLPALHKVRDELMILGFISLLLTIFEGDLLEVCVPQNADGLLCDGGILDISGRFGRPQRSGDNDEPSVDNSHRILAAESSTDVSAECPSDQEPFVSANAMHQTHILIFLMAVTHITLTSMVLFCVHRRITRLREAMSMSLDDATLLNPSGKRGDRAPRRMLKVAMRRERSNFFRVCCGACCATLLCRRPLHQHRFAALRAMFVLRHDLEPDFDFHKHVLDGVMARDFPELIGIHWWMWLILMLSIFIDGYIAPGLLQPISILVCIALTTRLRIVASQLGDASLLIREAANGDLTHSELQDRLHEILDNNKVTSTVAPEEAGVTEQSDAQGPAAAGGGDVGDVDEHPLQRMTSDDVCDNFGASRKVLSELQEAAKRALSDDIFPFGSPKIVRGSIQFVLFATALELSQNIFFVWQVPCLVDAIPIYISAGRVFFAILLAVYCTVVSVPLYTLVVHMGSKFNVHEHMKASGVVVIAQGMAGVAKESAANAGAAFERTVTAVRKQSQAAIEFASSTRTMTETKENP